MGKKNVYYEDPIFKERIIKDAKGNPVPAFTTREEALKMAASTIKKLNRRRWFDRGEPQRATVFDDPDDIASMWEKLEGLYNEPDAPQRPQPVSLDDGPSEPPDSENFL
jgi:hypothetical protein